eukprot:c9199_g1_i1.p2 GENE.c9199_g1_i1~~c9199_g1_i1.p2  ORF type:complete len:228 (-),score=53.11 c9199_g1_i1:87-770(-)
MHLFTSYIALHWLSSLPCPLPGSCLHPAFPSANQVQVAQWASHAHEDLVSFFRLRANELVHGGELVAVMVGRPNPSPSLNPFVAFPGHNNSSNTPAIGIVFDQLVSEGLIDNHELDSVNIPYFLRSPLDIEAAIADPRLEGSLKLVHVEAHSLPVGQGKGDAQDLENIARMFWAIHEPVIRTGLLKSKLGADALLKAAKERFQQVLVQTHSGKPAVVDFVSLVVRKQ